MEWIKTSDRLPTPEETLNRRVVVADDDGCIGWALLIDERKDQKAFLLSSYEDLSCWLLGVPPLPPTSIRVGDKVVFDKKVFGHIYSGCYDKYENHTFKVVAFHPLNHVELVCIDKSSLKVRGHVHLDIITKA